MTSFTGNISNDIITKFVHVEKAGSSFSTLQTTLVCPSSDQRLQIPRAGQGYKVLREEALCVGDPLRTR